MSLILDALNKADRERQDSESPPGLQSNHNFFASNEKIAGWKKTVVIVLGALVLIAAAIAYHLGKQSGSPPPVTVSESTDTVKLHLAAEQAQPIEDQDQPSVEKVFRTGNKTVVTAASQTAETRALLQKRRIEEQYKKIQAAKEKSPVTSADSDSEKAPDSISALYQPTESKKADQPTVAEKAGEKPSSDTNNDTVNDVPIVGTVRDLPWSAQEKIPTLMYTEHRYTNSANDYVTINGERKTKGQKIAAILTVDSILEDGVILRYENHQFKMPALNSWVNM